MPARPPRLLFWETTKACNLHCRHCRAEPVKEPGPDELTSAQARDLIAQAAALGVQIFVFSGGEPLLRPDLLELLAEAVGHGLQVAVATNGTLLDRDMVKAFRRLGVARVSVSLDGADAATHDSFRQMPGSFDEALAGCALLREEGQPFQINTTVTKHDREQLPGMVDLATRLGAVALHLFLLVPVGCGAEIPEDRRVDARQYEEILAWLADQRGRTALELRATCAPHLQRVILQRGRGAVPVGAAGGHPGGASSRGCLAGSGIVFVGSRGDVQPCGYLPVVVGNVRHTRLEVLWREHEVFAGLRDPERLRGRCGSCAFKGRCGGCRARAYLASGDLYGEEPMCAYGEERQDGGERAGTR